MLGAVAAVVTIATTGIGWPTIATSVLIVLLLLTGWFYLSRTRQLEQRLEEQSAILDAARTETSGLTASILALESDKQQLAGELDLLRSTNNALAEEVSRARSTDRDVIEQLGRLNAAGALMEEDRGRYEDAVRVMADRSRRSVRHTAQHIVYMIGETDAEDATAETYRTVAKNEHEPLLWHDVDLGVSNQSSAVRSFRDLEQTSVFEVLPNPPPAVKPLTYLPTGFRNNRLGVLILFDPEIRTSEREWRLTYTWRGMWDPLRSRHRDTAILRLGESRRVERDLVTVSFVFPLSAVNPRVRTGPNSPRVDPQLGADLKGRLKSVFTIENPGHEDYEWVLEIDDMTANQRH